MESADVIQAFYRAGGRTIRFARQTGDFGAAPTTFSVCGIIGNNLEIIIEVINDDPAESHFFDNVTVSAQTTLFSRANGAWNASGTWSTVALGGADCACTPGATDAVMIGNGNTVTFTADGDVCGVAIANTGILQWTGDFELNIRTGGNVAVATGGIMDNNGFTNAIIESIGIKITE